MLKTNILQLIILLAASCYINAQGEWKTYREEVETGKVNTGNIFSQIIEDNSGNIISSSSKGAIVTYKDNSWNSYSYVMKFKAPTAIWTGSCLDKSSNEVWFSAHTGVAMWNGSEVFLCSGILDEKGRMLYRFGEKEGTLCVFEGKEKIIIDESKASAKEMFVPCFMQSVYVDSKNTLWLGSATGEIITRKEGKWNVDKSLINANIEEMVKRDPKRVNKFFEDKEKTLWILTNSGVAQNKGNAVSIMKSLEMPFSIYQDSKGNLWIGYVSGIAKYDGSSWQLYEKDAGIVDVRLPGEILEDKEGNIWYCTRTIFATRKGGGLYKFDGSKWESHKVDKKGYYTDILLDKTGILWATTMTGAYQYKDNKWVGMRLTEGFATFYYEMYEDSKGSIWFGTSTMKGYLERYIP